MIKKGDIKIMLMDQTRIVVPHTMRKKLLEREHLSHSVMSRMSNSIRANMGYGTDMDHTVRQLKRLYATFSVRRSIRSDNGPPFFSKGFKEFCNEYCIELNLTCP